MFLGMITTVPMPPLFTSLPNSISITMSKTQNKCMIVATDLCLTCQVIDRSDDRYEPIYRDPHYGCPWGKSGVLVRIFTLETMKY
jgi:hypothetical protein